MSRIDEVGVEPLDAAQQAQLLMVLEVGDVRADRARPTPASDSARRWAVIASSSVADPVLEEVARAPTAGCSIPRQVCRLAPPRSASTSTTRLPRRASSIPSEAESRLLPMPPLPPPDADDPEPALALLARASTAGEGRARAAAGTSRHQSLSAVPLQLSSRAARCSSSWRQPGSCAPGRDPSPGARGASSPAGGRGSTCGRTGFRSSFMPASSGVRPPLRRLQATQEQTTFSQVVIPPRERGIDVIEVQLGARKAAAAVLAAVAVAQVDVVAREAHPGPRQVLAGQEHDDPRHADAAAHGADRVGVGVGRQRAPSSGSRRAGTRGRWPGRCPGRAARRPASPRSRGWAGRSG